MEHSRDPAGLKYNPTSYRWARFAIESKFTVHSIIALYIRKDDPATLTPLSMPELPAEAVAPKTEQGRVTKVRVGYDNSIYGQNYLLVIVNNAECEDEALKC